MTMFVVSSICLVLLTGLSHRLLVIAASSPAIVELESNANIITTSKMIMEKRIFFMVNLSCHEGTAMMNDQQRFMQGSCTSDYKIRVGINHAHNFTKEV
jgi:hypothetical protein